MIIQNEEHLCVLQDNLSSREGPDNADTSNILKLCTKLTLSDLNEQLVIAEQNLRFSQCQKSPHSSTDFLWF